MKRVLVVGCGALGGTFAGLLTESAPAEVVALSRNRAIVDAVNRHGYRLRGREPPLAIPGRVIDSLEGEAPFDGIILATQPTEVEEAARMSQAWLADDGTMVVLQNGLCEERIAAIVGEERVVGAIVAFGASTAEPGTFVRTSDGGITLGRIGSSQRDRTLESLSALLEPIGPTQIASNFRGARWSKLAINCVISTLGTLAGCELGKYIRSTKGRYLALEIITETVQVASAEGIALEKVSGTLDLDWMALSEAERRGHKRASIAAKHAMLLAVGARYRRLRSSMLAAIERGRPPAIDFLNGEVVSRGKRHGIATPVNARAVEMVHDLAAGRRTAGMHFVDELAVVSARVRGSWASR